ncbi:MAG: AMP-binding protein, partial [Deltaproteobacteria bacterium]|nr:AMP-binding protein [Deltaproteobacteria bacterium]
MPSPLELTSSQAEFAEGLVKRFQARTRLSRESLETAGPAAGAGGLAPGPLSGAAYPPVVRHSAGARFLDLDGNDCLDFSLAMGILGHNPPFVTEAVSRTLDRGLPADGSLSDAARGAAALAAPLLGRGARASFFSSEAGAVRAAIILARAVTGRRLVAAFSRCTPGFREHLAFVGDPEGRALPADPGSLLLLDFGTERALSALQEAGPSLACVVAEPAPSSDLRFQSPSYLARLCRAARERGAAVVFDETVLGPGFLPGGAGPRLGSEADLSVWGGGLAGGFPAGILCVSEDFLGRLDLRGAGALGAPAFPLSLAALAAALSWHEANAAGYRERARALLEALSLRLNLWFQEKGAPLRLVSFGPFFRLRRLGPAAPGAAELEGELFRLLLLESGIYTGSREGRGAGRVMAVSAAHGPEDTRALGDAVVKAVLALREGGFGFSAGRGAPRVYVELPPALAPGLAPAGGEGAAPPAREAVAFRAEGQIPVQALREAVLELPSRHEALNRSVSRTADGAWIKTEEEAALVLRVAPDFASETDADAVRPFLGPRDPRLAPPAGAALVERGGSSVFLLESLAAAVDRESLMILLRDVSGLLRRGGKLPPPADLSEAEAEVARYLASDPPWAAGSGKGRAGLSREFWTGELARAGFSRIPLDNPLLRSSGRARLVTRELTGPPLDSYRAWTASSGVAPEIFFAGALALALTRAFPECPGPWLFGRLWQGRPGPLSRAAAGPFARTALLAVPAPSEDAPWTAALQEAFRRSDRHRAVAPEELAGGGRPALPEACVSHEHLHPELLSWPGVEGTFVPLPPSGGSSPVNLHLAEERDRIHLFLKVSEALSPASSRAVLDAFLSAWERLARIPASLLAPEEGPGDEEHFALGGAAPAGRAGGEAAPGVAGAGGPAPEGAVTPGGGAGIGAVDGGAIIDLDTSGVERAPAQPASPAPTGSAEAPFGAEFPEEGERLLPADANPFASFPQPLPPGRREEIEAFYGADLQKALPCAPGQEDWFLPGRLPAPPPSTRVETRRAVMRGVPDPGATIRRARALCEGLDIVRLAVHPGLPPVNALSRRIPKVSEVLRFLDLAGLPLPRRERSLAETALRDAEELSDSSRPGAFRATLVRTGPDSSELMLSTSRLVYDPRSAQKVLEFLVSAPEGARPSFPPLAGALSSLPGPGGLERGLKSRKAALEAVDAPTRIPRRPGFAEARDGGGIQSVTTRLRPETNALLAEAAAREGVPKALFLAGVWAVLLGRLTLSETVVFGLELPGDQGAGAPAGWPVDQAGWPLGPLAIQMPIPARLPWGGTFSDLLKETAAAAAAAARTDFISRGRLAPLTRLGADVFSHGFSYLPAFAPGPGAPEVERVKESGSPGACSLSLNVRDHARMPELHFVYRTALYDHWQVEVIALAFQQVMEDAANSPGATLGSLRLSDPEQDLSLVRQNNARPSRYAGGTVLDLFARAVKENPSSPAVKGGDLAQSYRDLDNESEKFAAQLKVAGYGPRCRVALIFAPGAQEYPQTLLGALKSGACAVPLSTGVPPDLLGQLLAECAPDLVVCSRRLPQNLASCLESLGDTPVVDHQGFYLRGGSSGVMGFSKLSVHFVKRERDRVSIDPDSPAYIVYVSGRLLGGRGADGPEPPAPPADDAASPPAAPGAPQPGGPRGVVVSHRALCNQAAWSGDFLDIAPGDLHCAFATPASDVSLMEILVPLTRGAAVLLLPGGESTAAENLWETVHSHRVTSLSLPLRKLRQYASRHPLYGLKTILTWGRGLSGDNLKGLIKDMSGCRIVNCFGLPECAITSLAEDARPGSFPETMGRPAPNCPSYLLDREMRLVPAGFPGELCCGGVQTALGYDRRPGETARAFTADPFAPLSPPEYRAERLFRTGILARRRPDGRLDYFGRAGERTVIRGVMVPVHEVERTLLGAEGVLEALVVRREDYSFYFEPYLCAYLTLSDDRPASAAAVRRHLADRLPGYMVPERIVILPEFPLDAFGRVDVKALPAPGPEDGAAAGSGGGPEAGAGPAAPRGPGSPPEDEGPPAPAAADLAPVLAPGRDPFAHAPGDMGEAERDRIRARAGDDLALVMPLSPGQCALLAGGGHSPAEPRSVGPMVTTVKAGLRGRLEPQAFRESLRRVINRHDVFRLAIAPRDAGLPVQFWKRGAPRLAEVFTEEDLRFEDARRREARLAALEARHRSDLLDLGRAPLFRASLLRVADDGWELLCSFHRLAFDGWSVEIFFRELWGGAEAPGAPPAPAYASYMERRRAPEARERDLEFWRGELGDLRGPTRLPGRFPLAGEPGVPASLVSDAAALKLPRDLSDAVRGAAAALGAPLECFLLAAWGVLVARATRSGSATCGLAVSGREGGGGLPSLMGPAWAVVPVTVRAPAGAPFSDVVAETAAAAAAAAAHAGVSLFEIEGVSPLRGETVGHLFGMRGPVMPADPGGLRLEGVEERSRAFAFPLAVSWREGPPALEAEFIYDTGHFLPWQVNILSEAYLSVLASASRDPSLPVNRLRLASDQAMLAQLEAEGALARVYEGGTVPLLFSKWAALGPKRPAVAQGAASLTYGDLARASGALAAALASLGVEPGRDRVGLLMDRTPAYPGALLGVFRSGAAAVPLPAGDEGELLALLADAAPRAVVVDGPGVPPPLAAALGRAPGAAVVDPAGRVLLPARGAGGPGGGAPAAPPPGPGDAGPCLAEPDFPAYVCYARDPEGGGGQVGVVISHAALLNLTAWTAEFLELRPEDTQTAFLPFTSEISFLEILTPLASGARTLVLTEEERRDLALLRRSAADGGATSLWLPPGALKLFVSKFPLSPFSIISAAGEGLPSPIRILDPGACRISSILGVPECAGAAAGESSAPGSVPASLGFPAPNCPAYVLDDQGELLPAGFTGELYVGGVQTALGYLNRPDLTERLFPPDPFREFSPPSFKASRLFRTGILAVRHPDGRLYHMGRVPRGEAPLPRLAPPAVRPASASGAFVPLEGAFEAPPVGPAPGLSEAPPPPAGGPAAGRATAPPEFPIAPLDEAAPPGSPAPAAAPEATHGTGFPEDVTAVEVIPVEELPPEGAPAAAPHPAAELVYLSSLAEEEGLAEAPAAAPAAEAAPAAGTPPAAEEVDLSDLDEEEGLAEAPAAAPAAEAAPPVAEVVALAGLGAEAVLADDLGAAPAAAPAPAAVVADLADLGEEAVLADDLGAAPAPAAPPAAGVAELSGLGEEAELADDLGAAPAPAPPPAGAAPPSGRTARGEAAPGISEGDAVPVEDIEVADDLLDDLGFPVPAPPAPPGPAA